MPDSNPASTVESKLQLLRDAYRERIGREIESITELLNQLQASPSDTDILTQLHAELHTLSGTAGTFGFETIGKQARRMETLIAGVSTEPGLSPASLDFPQCISQLQQAIDSDAARTFSVSVESPAEEIDSALVVWLVERDLMLANYVEQQLNSFGFQVEHFDNIESLNRTRQADQARAEPSLMLIDHRASEDPYLKDDPVTSWQEKLKNYRCPIIFTGAEESFDARLNAVRCGARSYFPKPLDALRIAGSISRLLNSTDDGPERVLIVEDDRELAMHCIIVLQQAGMKVKWLDQPRELLGTVSEFSPELILMDLRLPEVDGTELVKLLGQFEQWREVPVVYLSAEPDRKVQAQAMLEGGDAFLEKPISTELLINTCRARVHRLRQLRHAITMDGQTGLMKHGAIKKVLQAEWDHAARQSTIFSVIMLDIDHFKTVNDTYGHAVGDLVIATIGNLLRQHFRQTDKLGRYGGEEFMLVLPYCSAENAVHLVETMRQSFSAIQFFGDGDQFSCTLSAGVVDNRSASINSADALLESADKLLYQAKNSGRNRVCSTGS